MESIPKIIADVFLLWHCVNTHLNDPDQELPKHQLYGDDDHLIKCSWLAASLTLSIPIEALRV